MSLSRRQPCSRISRWQAVEQLEVRAVFAAGELDTSFGASGIVRTEFNQSATYGSAVQGTVIQSDGRIVAGGEGGLARFNSDGSIDTDFGIAGRVAPPVYVRAIALQTDGKLLVAGGTAQFNSNDMVVARYLPSGELDPTWDNDGVANIDFGGPNEWVNAILVEPSGRIVVAGGVQESIAITRLQTNGQLDVSFGNDGKVVSQYTRSDTAYGLARQANGRILVVGTSWVNLAFNNINFDMFVMRVNTNGTIDRSFDSDGIAFANFTSSPYSRDSGRGIAVQADGRIVITGPVYGNFRQYVGVARFNSNGTLDNSFGTEGRSIYPVSTEVLTGSIFVLDDQQLLVTSYENVMRLTSTGALDATYGSGGRSPTGGFAYAAARGADGSVVIGGNFFNLFAVKRLRADGAIDTNFSSDGVAFAAMGPSNDIANHSILQDNGSLIVVGSSQLGFAVARYLSSGQLDTSFSQDGLQVLRFADQFYDATATSVALQPDGKIVIVGWVRELNNSSSYSRVAVVRLNTDGSPDTSFSDDGWQTTDLGGSAQANSVLIQPDGKILVGGVWNDHATLFRFLTGGSLDTSFSTDGVASMQTAGSTISNLALQPDGRILAAGSMRPSSFVTTAYTSILMVARFNARGALDPTFGVNGRMVDPGNRIRTADDIALLPDGSFVVVGDSSAYSQGVEASKIAVAQYDSSGNPSGELGTRIFSETEISSQSDFISFSPNSWANAIHRQADGQYLVVGYTPSRMIIRRVTANGLADSSFAGDGVLEVGLPNERWRATNVLQQADGRILVTGHAQGPSANGQENDFVVVRLQNQLPNSASTKVALNSQGAIEITDLWNRSDSFALARTDNAIVITETSADSSFQVIELPGVSGHGTRQVTIPLSLIESTGRPLIINGLGGDDLLTITSDSFDAPRTGLSFRGGTGLDKLSLANHLMPITWAMSGATNGSARPVGRVPITFVNVDSLEGGLAEDNFLLNFQGSSDRLRIDGGQGGINQLRLTANANMQFLQAFAPSAGTRLVVDDGQRQEYSLRNIGEVSLRGGIGNNLIDGRNFLGRATYDGGDGDDVIYGSNSMSTTLRGGNGNDLLYAGAADDKLYGGAGDDVLSGNSGVDQLYGEDGRDVLEGGASPDMLFGGAGEDILIGGYLTLIAPSDPVARDAALAAWRSPANYATRINQLTSVGVGPGNSLKVAPNSTVYNDRASDLFFGNGGLDWFILDVDSETPELRDRLPSEQLFDV